MNFDDIFVWDECGVAAYRDLIVVRVTSDEIFLEGNYLGMPGHCCDCDAIWSQFPELQKELIWLLSF